MSQPVFSPSLIFCYYYYYYYYLTACESSHQSQLVLFYESLSSSKFLKVSRTLLSILANLNNVVVWVVSIRPTLTSTFPVFGGRFKCSNVIIIIIISIIIILFKPIATTL